MFSDANGHAEPNMLSAKPNHRKRLTEGGPNTDRGAPVLGGELFPVVAKKFISLVDAHPSEHILAVLHVRQSAQTPQPGEMFSNVTQSLNS